MRLLSRAHDVLALLPILFLGACAGVPSSPEAPSRLADCGWLPHCVNSQSGRGVQAAKPIEANAQQWQRLKTWIATRSDWDVTADEGTFLQAVVTTPTMKFRDDVQLLFIPEAGLIQVRSSSRLGISDLGTNARRVDMLRAQITRAN